MSSEDEDTASNKMIILAEGNTEQIGLLLDKIKLISSVYLDIDCYNKECEYKYLIKKINQFIKEKDKPILVVRFSGKEFLLKEIGDRFSELIIGISFNEKSSFYTKKPIETFIRMINIFMKEQ